MGGLSRRYTTIQTIEQNEDIDHLLLDSGNLLFANPRSVTEKNSATQIAMGIASIYKEMNYDAVNIGPNDLAAGIGFLKKLDFLPWVSANLYDNSGGPLFRPYILKTDKKLKYAIIGLTSPPLDTSTEYTYRSWQKILPPLLEELIPNADCIVILSALSENENRELAQKYPDIRLIFTSRSTSGNIPPRIVNKALITQTANRGKYLGQLYLLNPGLYDWVDTAASNVATIEKQREAIRYRLTRIDYLMKQNNGNPGTLATLKKQKIGIQKQLETLEHTKSDETDFSKSTFKVSFTPLTTNIREDKKINDMIKEIKKEAGALKN